MCPRFGEQRRSTDYITENVTAGDQQMVISQRAFYSKSPTDDCFICPVVARFAQVVNKGSPSCARSLRSFFRRRRSVVHPESLHLRRTC